ncbi:MAG TPA: hypothetical protein V6C81_23435 [Planktothrix sp.]|jgi:hypothetical protein
MATLENAQKFVPEFIPYANIQPEFELLPVARADAYLPLQKEPDFLDFGNPYETAQVEKPAAPGTAGKGSSEKSKPPAAGPDGTGKSGETEAGNSTPPEAVQKTASGKVAPGGLVHVSDGPNETKPLPAKHESVSKSDKPAAPPKAATKSDAPADHPKASVATDQTKPQTDTPLESGDKATHNVKA